MSPILIESKDIFKVGLATAVLASGLFVSGMFYGYSKAESHRNKPVTSAALDLPAVADVVAAEREPQTPQVIDPGSDRDVDAVSAEVDAAELAVEAATAAVVEAQAQPEPEAKTKTNDQAAARQASEDNDKTVTLAVGGPVAADEDDPLVLMKDTAEEQAARYTVQVGLFSSEGNAERRVEELQALELNAWSSVFTNKQQQQRYNVRFGYFDTYRDAKQALQAFKNRYNGEGYLVSLKR